MQSIAALLAKVFVSGLMKFFGDRLDAWKKDRNIEKVGALKAKEKSNVKRTKKLGKVEKLRSRLRTDKSYRDRLRRKYTRDD